MTIIVTSIYNDIFSHILPNDPILWLFAFGGIVFALIMAIISALIFVETGSKVRGILATIGTAGIVLCIVVIHGILFDFYATTAFVHYSPWDWLWGIAYVLSYFAQLQFGNIEMFWFYYIILYFVILPFTLKGIAVQKKSKYLKNRVRANGY